MACGGGSGAPPSNVAAAPARPVCPVVRDGACKTHALVVVVRLTPTMAGARLAKVKQAIEATAETLDRTADRLGVIAVDTSARVVVELGGTLRLDALAAGAGTAELDDALRLAGARLRGLVALSKYVLLVTDTAGAGSPALATQLRGEGVNVSAIGIVGADRTALLELVEAGEGRLYMIEELDALPRVFAKEAREAIRTGLLDNAAP